MWSCSYISYVMDAALMSLGNGTLLQADHGMRRPDASCCVWVACSWSDNEHVGLSERTSRNLGDNSDGEAQHGGAAVDGLRCGREDAEVLRAGCEAELTHWAQTFSSVEPQGADL